LRLERFDGRVALLAGAGNEELLSFLACVRAGLDRERLTRGQIFRLRFQRRALDETQNGGEEIFGYGCHL